MFCIHCGTQLPGNSQFCAKCGRSPVDISTIAKTVPLAVDTSPVTSTAGRTPPATPTVSAAPYGAFLFAFVCFAIMAASFLFLLCSAAAQSDPSAFPKVGATFLIGFLFTANWASRSWRSIKDAEPETDAVFHNKHRSLGRRTGIAVSVLLLSAVIAGVATGTRIAKRTALARLADQISTLGMASTPVKQQFVALASRETPTMKSYIQRCSELEPVNRRYRSLLQEMDSLLGQVQPKLADSPAMLASVTTMRSILTKDLEATALIEKEVQLAKHLSALMPTGQSEYYETKIEPVREQQFSVATEQIELVRSAKAKGVRLPDQMLAELGIK